MQKHSGRSAASAPDEEKGLLSNMKQPESPPAGSKGVALTFGLPTVLVAGLCYCTASGRCEQ